MGKNIISKIKIFMKQERKEKLKIFLSLNFSIFMHSNSGSGYFCFESEKLFSSCFIYCD